jgi:hypothetical protein
METPVVLNIGILVLLLPIDGVLLSDSLPCIFVEVFLMAVIPVEWLFRVGIIDHGAVFFMIELGVCIGLAVLIVLIGVVLVLILVLAFSFKGVLVRSLSMLASCRSVGSLPRRLQSYLLMPVYRCKPRAVVS